MITDYHCGADFADLYVSKIILFNSSQCNRQYNHV